MNLTSLELEFLAAWAKEEHESDCWLKPAHALQATHQVPGVQFIRLIKAWAKAHDKKDEDILQVADNPRPAWPWRTPGDLQARDAELNKAAQPAKAAQANSAVA